MDKHQPPPSWRHLRRLTATLSGGTVELSNDGATANVLGTSSQFNVTSGGELQVLAPSAGQTNPLGQAAIAESGGILQFISAPAPTLVNLGNNVTLSGAATSTIDLAGAVTGVTLGTLTSGSGNTLTTAASGGGTNHTLTFAGAVLTGNATFSPVAATNITISGGVTESPGPFSLTLNSGTLSLDGTGAYTGGTIVNGGTLVVGTMRRALRKRWRPRPSP